MYIHIRDIMHLAKKIDPAIRPHDPAQIRYN